MRVPAVSTFASVLRLWLLMLAAAPGWAQPVAPPSERVQEKQAIERRFASPYAWDLAAGAELVGRYGREEFVPRLQELARHPVRDVQQAALYALIRLRAKVDDALMEAVFKDHFDEAMILASLHLKDHSGLLLRLRSEVRSDYQWAVVNGLLASLQLPEHVALLLREWTFEVPLEAGDADGRRFGLGGGVGMGCGDFPVIYQIAIGKPSPGYTVMVSGKHALSYALTDGCGSGGDPVSRSAYTLDYFRDMAYFTEDPPSTYIPFRDAQQYLRDAAAFREKVNAYVRRLDDALIRLKRLDSVDAYLHPPAIKLVVDDQRKDKSEPLPPIE